MPRYTYRRLAKLPSTAAELRRHTVLNLPGMLHGLSFEHMVMEPGAAVPISFRRAFPTACIRWVEQTGFT